MKKKNNVIKGILALAAVLVFFLISENFQKEERATFTVDTEAFNVVDSEKKLYDRLMMGVPFFRPEYMDTIRKYDLMAKIDNMEIPVLEENRTFRIERIWEDNLNFAVTYSLSLLPGDDEPESIPYLAMDGMSFIADGKQPIETGIHIQPDIKFEWSSTPPGVVYKNRIYRTVWFDNTSISRQLYDTVVKWMNDPEIESSEEAFRSINQVKFKGVELVHLKEKGEPTITQLDNIKVNMQLGKADQLLESVDLNKTVDLGHGIQVLYKRLEHYLRGSRLYVEFLEPSPKFSEVFFQIESGGVVRGSGMSQDETGEQFLNLPTANANYKDELSLKLINGTIPAENQVEFTISKEKLSSFKNELEKGRAWYDIKRKLDTVADTGFSLYRLVKMRDDSIGFEIGMRNEDDDSDFHMIWFQDYAIYQKHQHDRTLNSNHPFIKVSNEKGELMTLKTNHGSSLEDGARTQYYGYDKERFLQAEEIHVRLFNIPDRISFSENETTIKLPTTD